MKCKKPQPGCCAAQAGASSGTLDVVQRGGTDGGSNSERCDLVPSERRRPPQRWPSTRYRASTRLSLIAPIRVVVVADPNPLPAAPVGRDQTPSGVIIWASEADADAKEEGVPVVESVESIVEDGVPGEVATLEAGRLEVCGTPTGPPDVGGPQVWVTPTGPSYTFPGHSGAAHPHASMAGHGRAAATATAASTMPVSCCKGGRTHAQCPGGQ